MKRYVRRYAVACTTALALVLGGGLQVFAMDAVSGYTPVGKAKSLYKNGHIYTMTEFEKAKYEAKGLASDPSKAIKVEAVAVDHNGKIMFAGTLAQAQQYVDDATRVIDLKGKTMFPGFIDGHGHFPGEATTDLFKINLNSPPLGPVNTMADLIALVKTKADTIPAGGWVIGTGYDDTLIAEKSHPNREYLDQASNQHFVYVSHSSGHISSANSKIIDELIMPQGSIINGVFTKKDGTPIPGAEIKDGRLTGVLFEMDAMGLVQTPATTPEESLQANAYGSQIYAAAGVTTADQGATALPTLPGGLQTSLQRNELDVRVILHPLTAPFVGALNHSALRWDTKGTPDPYDDTPTPESPRVGDDLTRLQLSQKDYSTLPENYLLFGAWKQIYDGSNQGYTGYFKHPGYWDKGSHAPHDPKRDWDATLPEEIDALLGMKGTLNFPPSMLKKTMDFYHKNAQPVETHTNGSWAAEDFMTSIELAVASHPEVKDMRHTFIHGQMEERQVVERATGNYANLDSTVDMYSDLSGVFRQSGTETAMNGTQYTAEALRAALNNGQLIKDQNLVSSYFINHTFFWGDRHLEIFMGPGRGKQMNPVGWAAAYGHNFTTHNDASVTPISPLRSLQSSVTRTSTSGQLISGSSKDLDAKTFYPEVKGGAEKPFWDYDQRVNILQALLATTIMPAYQNHIDDKVGSILPGKHADFVILDQNPFDIAQSAPQTLADLRVSATIVDDKVVHGVLPDSGVFIGQLAPSYKDQPNDATVTLNSASTITPKDAEKGYALPGGVKSLGLFEFKATITDGDVAVMAFNLLGHNGTVADLQLHKVFNTATSLPYTYTTATDRNAVSGNWWVYELKAPTIPLAPDAKMEDGKFYTVNFTIGDNSPYDVDPAVGVISDPVGMFTSGALPTNGIVNNQNTNNDDGGSSSGCTIGTSPAYDLLLLLAGLSGIAVIRIVRRRSHQS